MIPRSLIASLVLFGTMSPAVAGDAAAGLALVSRYCTLCHAVGRSANPPNLALPFMAIAERGGRGGAWLRAWLAAPHPELNIQLSRAQIDDVIAYLDGLVPDIRH